MKTDLKEMTKYWDTQAVDDDIGHIAHARTIEEFEEVGKIHADMILKHYHSWRPKAKDIDVLDIGCGIGRMLKEIGKRGIAKSLTGIDVSEEMVKKGAEYCKDIENIKFIKGSGEDLKGVDDNSMDLVYSYIVFQHMPRHILPKYLAEAKRVLRPGGFMIFQVPSVKEYLLKEGMLPNEPEDDNYRWMRYYTTTELYELCKPHFDVCQMLGAIIVILRKENE